MIFEPLQPTWFKGARAGIIPYNFKVARGAAIQRLSLQGVNPADERDLTCLVGLTNLSDVLSVN